MTAKRMVSADLNAITLDYRIRQQLVGNFRRHRPCFVSRLGRQLELEIFTLADVLDPAIPERVQCVDDRLALRIEYRWLQRDEHSRAHQDTPVVRRCSGRPERASRDAATGI